MMANLPADILVELEQAVATCPPDRCARILSGIVQLLTGSRDRPQELLAGVVDGVLLRLTERVEAKSLGQDVDAPQMAGLVQALEPLASAQK